MATGAAGDGLLRCMFEACISGGDAVIQRRPYHKNCSCALHNSRGHCSHTFGCNTVSYPVRRSWSEGSLALMAAAAVSGHSSPPCTAAASPVGMKRVKTQLVLCKEGNEDN